jgi:uncharacterized protein YdiU (UPF0061 family)
MRVSDLPEHEQRAHWERVQQALDRADEANARLTERAAQREADGSAAEERYQERLRQAEQQQRERAAAQQPEPLPATIRTPARDWQAEEKWVSRIILKETQPAFGEIGKMLARTDHQLDRLEDRVTKSEEATVSLLLELERKLADLERDAIRKPQKPRLIAGGGSDAA